MPGMVDNPSHDNAVRAVTELLEVDFGDWELSTIKELAAARPGWELQEFADEGAATVTRARPASGRWAPALVLDAGKLGLDSKRYAVGRVDLMRHPRRVEVSDAVSRITALADVLETVGGPVRYEDCGGAPGLRWRGERHTVILQSNRWTSWLAVHPVSERHAEAADTAEALHDGGRPGDTARVLTYEKGAALVRRREAFGEVFDAVVGRIGAPTAYGGSAGGARVRWRNERQILQLAGDAEGARLEVHGTAELEADEERRRRQGEPGTAEDFRGMSRLWQINRAYGSTGQGERTGGPAAPDLDVFRDVLALLFRSFAEQMPPQIGRHWAAFQIAYKGGSPLGAHFDPDGGLRISRRFGTEGDAAQAAASASDDVGWHTRGATSWRAEFPEPVEDAAEQAARLVTAQLRADGVRDPGEECRLHQPACNYQGPLDLYGTGVRV